MFGLRPWKPDGFTLALIKKDCTHEQNKLTISNR